MLKATMLIKKRTMFLWEHSTEPNRLCTSADFEIIPDPLSAVRFFITSHNKCMFFLAGIAVHAMMTTRDVVVYAEAGPKRYTQCRFLGIHFLWTYK